MLLSKKRNAHKWKRLKTRNHIVQLEQLYQRVEHTTVAVRLETRLAQHDKMQTSS
ncbi:hypothetical protein [Exiguobacterium sp. s193]|uniref:hypothetical protein n=1 Tax=Exiguobacterium sp. s193 TaxID=2751207 RepID=UPI001BE5602B|nr:hypothetical protein [Exiguobacterium sp. s193]